MPQSCKDKRPHKDWKKWDQDNQASTDLLDNIIPQDPNKPYDMLNVIETVADRNEFYQIMPNYAKNIMTGFIEVEGRSVGIVAN